MIDAKKEINKQLEDLRKTAKLFEATHKKHPSRITRDFYEKHGSYRRRKYEFLFKTFKNFKQLALNNIEVNPEDLRLETQFSYSENIPADILDDFNRDSFERSIKANSFKKQRYFVTGAVEGQTLNRQFFNSILSYCDYNNAKLVILPIMGPVTSDSEIGYPTELAEYMDSFASEYIFCNTLRAMDLRINPQNILPLTGLIRYGSHNYSVIIASPKQHMKCSPSFRDHPNIVHSTGVCTNPINYRHTRRGRIAMQDHTIGGLIVEVESNNRFYLRQVNVYSKDNSFVDLGIRYFPKGKPKKEKTIAIYGGDSHFGWQKDSAIRARDEQIDLLKPDLYVSGDIFDGTSISHHHENDIITQVNRPDHLKTLEDELNVVADSLNSFVKRHPKVTFGIIQGNHDNALLRYLSEQRFANDRFNYRIAIELLQSVLDNNNPIEYWVNKKYPKIQKNLVWFDRKTTRRVTNRYIEIATHGDLSADGKGGGPINIESSYGIATIGHTHTPYIYRDIYCAGTDSIMDLPYRDISNTTAWMAANVAHYTDGERQLLFAYSDGKWKLS